MRTWKTIFKKGTELLLAFALGIGLVAGMPSDGNRAYAEEETENTLSVTAFATKEQLMTLTGIGENKALEIIAYRKEHGGFQTKEELMNISGIKEGTYNKIKDEIVLD